MTTTILQFDRSGCVVDLVEHPKARVVWTWIDVVRSDRLDEQPPAILDELRLDPLALHDAFNEVDLPKFEDFGDHALIVMHGLNDADRISTYELDCFVAKSTLVTVHPGPSRAVVALRQSILANPDLAVGGGVEVLARLADGVNRRMLAVVEAFDQDAEELVDRALQADRYVLADVSAVRSDLGAIRRVMYPQREALDLLRSADSELLTASARRRLADVVDVTTRALSGLDAARSMLTDTVELYRGAEARAATEVTKVLTVYAAILLPLSLIVGFFGMNHVNLPTIESRWGWISVLVAMVMVAAVSLGVFVSVGWIQRPSGRRAGTTLGKGVIEAARAPAQVASAVFTMTTFPFSGSKSHDPPSDRV